MKNHDSKFWLGLILVIAGALLIIENYGFFFIDLRHLIFSWHTIFVIIGAVILSRCRNSIWGIGFLVLGLYGWGSHIFPQFFDFVWRDFWPIILIIIGFAILFRKRNGHKFPEAETNKEFSTGNIYTSSEQLLDINTFMNSTKRKITTDNFQGGKITNLLGATVIDFSDSKLSPKENILEVTCILGGVEIAVPKNWKVIVNISAVFGGVDDKRYSSAVVEDKEEGVLVVKGSVIFGACEILHYV